MEREINIDSIGALEEQIKEHERAITKLKRTRNSLLNVSTLPPEVLGNIFLWNVTLEEPGFDGLEEVSHNFLLVCHHWFEVASRTPDLWTFWGNNLEDWEKRCHRSRVGAPLDLVLDEEIYADGPFGEPQRVILENRAARDTIRRVHLRSYDHDLLASIISPLTSPRGELRTKSLESFIVRSEDNPTDVSDFFARSRLPKVRYLELVNCTISSWDHLTSQTTLLTTLKLSSNNASPTPTMPQLLSMLASNPHLQELKLNARAIPNDDGDGASYQVSLRHLEELRLDGDVGQVFRLLRRLECPQKMGKLSISLSHCMVADISHTIGPYLRDHLRRRGRSQNGLGLSLSHCGFGLITFHVGDVGEFHPSTSESARMVSFLSITFGLDQALPGDVQERGTLDLIAHIPREEIVYFRAGGTLAAVEDLRVQMPNLKALDLFMVPLYAAFQTPEQDGSHVHEKFPPSLQHLFLERLIVNGYDWVPLIVFLTRRASSGNQLDSLLIGGPCHMCSRMAEGVRGIVRRFHIGKGCLESWCPFGRCL